MLNSQSMCNVKRITFFLRHNLFNGSTLEEVCLVILMQFNLGTFSWSMTEFNWNTVYISSQFTQTTWINITDGGRKENQGTWIHFAVLLYKGSYKGNASYFFLLNVMPGIVSCYTHWRTTLSCSNRIISAPVSHCSSHAEWQMWWLNYLLQDPLVQ